MRVAPDLGWPLVTARLHLRPFGATDVDALLPLHADPVAVRYVPFEPRDRAGVVDVLARKTANRTLAADGDLLELAVVRTADDALVGDVLLALSSLTHENLEVGYLFGRAYEGQGYATEAVGALLALAFDTFEARRVTARVDTRNDASRRLLLRLGFRQEAELVENEWFKGTWGSEADYALLRRAWTAGRKA